MPAKNSRWVEASVSKLGVEINPMWRSFRRDKKNVKKFTRLRRCGEENVRRCKEIKGQDAYKVKRDVIGIVREG